MFYGDIMVCGTPSTDDLPKNFLINTALEVLEFGAVRDALLQHVQFFNARDIISSISPISDERRLSNLHKETVEAAKFLSEVGDLNFSFSEDLHPIVQRAGMGGVLTPLELISTAEFIELVSSAKSKLFNNKSFTPTLNDSFSIVANLTSASKEIRLKITPNGELSEDASPSIKLLRNKSKSALNRLNKQIQRCVARYKQYLSDSVVSVRSDRLVLPVRSDRRRDVSGIVHGVSDSGATVFVEPFEVVEIANSWRENVEEEKREEIRIFRQISEFIGELESEFIETLEVAALIDSIFARARYSLQIGGSAVFRFSKASSNSRIFLKNARHPLLGDDAVAIDVDIDTTNSVLVISGPNTGGKTVAMKTVGLLALMNQSGILIPADIESELPIFDHIFADIGDGQNISQSVSTFSSHIRNIASILKFANNRSLVLLDELGSSTDPDEGAALAKSISSSLAERGVFCIVTTHFRSVAAFADSKNGMTNAGVELDQNTMLPTYKLIQKSWGRSFGILLASKLGISEKMIESAKNFLDQWFTKSERLLDQLEKDKDHFANLNNQITKELDHLKDTRELLLKEIDYLLVSRNEMIDSFRAKLILRFENILKRLRRVEKSIGSKEVQTKFELDAIKEELSSDQWIPSNNDANMENQGLNIGDQVRIKSIETNAIIDKLPGDSKDHVIVSIGSVQLSISKNQIEKIPSIPYDDSTSMGLIDFKDDAAQELDLRGVFVDDAIIRLQNFLDDSILHGISRLRIIHGHGTGVLRKSIREYLENYPMVKTFGPEESGFGGNGATFVEIK